MTRQVVSISSADIVMPNAEPIVRSEHQRGSVSMSNHSLTAKGVLHLSVTVGAYMKQCAMLERIALLMRWKEAVGLSKTERHNCFVHFIPQPKPWTARNLDRVKWLSTAASGHDKGRTAPC